MSATGDDFRFMAQALRLAGRGLWTTHPNPRVGCVVVAGGEIVGEGWHEQAGGPHAEVMALGQAGRRAAGATAYVTLEPCCHHGRTPPCADALVAAAVARVVYAVDDPDPRVSGQGARALRAAGVEVQSDVLAVEARALNAGFISRFERGRPYVRVKVAASLDGRTALACGASRWITGEDARRDGHGLRARSSCVMTGIGTVLADDPALTARPSATLSRQPTRVVLDSTLRMPPAARMLKEPGETRIFCIEAEASRRAALESAGAVIDKVPARDGRIDLHAVMRRLADLGANEVLVEAGPVVNGAVLDAGLVDEIVMYMAPHILGTDGHGMFASAAIDAMASRHEFSLTGVRRVGRDLRLEFTRKA
ncbi:MAG: bifunctional diaminohydroxyphosphoribosylaminopyrimidine deaminase/5-amino-6-(5-phosphoribosylamino)uracil reductase RibD [Gammaproteobacteria bacterium]|nr:bifunctional diaminohydroxyphosphoribosylaminopyrimidine deaminase/5-amino-6-(5-phosphoribosylamino)uracil reductase RibD [Gammaproteobacteria bacterium]